MIDFAERLDSRLLYLGNIKSGWLDGEGCEVSKAAIDDCRKTLLYLHDFNPKFSTCIGLYPTPDGNIQVEWEIHNWAIELCFDGKVVDFLAFDMDDPNDNSSDRTAVINSGQSVAILGLLMSLIGSASLNSKDLYEANCILRDVESSFVDGDFQTC